MTESFFVEKFEMDLLYKSESWDSFMPQIIQTKKKNAKLLNLGLVWAKKLGLYLPKEVISNWPYG